MLNIMKTNYEEIYNRKIIIRSIIDTMISSGILPDSMFLFFWKKEFAISQLFITSGMLFQSMLPLKFIDFMPKPTVDVLGSMIVSFILRSLFSGKVQAKMDGLASTFTNSKH